MNGNGRPTLVALVALAVERRTDPDLQAIKALIDEIDQGVGRGKLNTHKAVEFHRLIGEACHNRLISMVMEALVIPIFIILFPILPRSHRRV